LLLHDLIASSELIKMSFLNGRRFFFPNLRYGKRTWKKIKKKSRTEQGVEPKMLVEQQLYRKV